MRYGLAGLTTSAALMSTVAPSARAEIQTTGVIGQPNATTTVSGEQLPPPDPKFGGVIKEKATESTPWWPAARRAAQRRAQRPAHHDG